MTDEFEYNCPQVFDFNEGDEIPNMDSYFDNNVDGRIDPLHIDPQEASSSSSALVQESELSDPESDSVFFTPGINSSHQKGSSTGSTMFLSSKLRRSLSLNNLLAAEPQNKNSVPNQLSQHSINLSNVDKKQSESNVSVINKRHRSKSVSKEHINRLAQPKHGSQENLNNNQFVSMAESINKFQSGTPRRFRSKPLPQFKQSVVPLHIKTTIAHSPNLLTRRRIRPVHTLTREEIEQQELDEARKNKIKAHPVDKRILKGPLKPLIPVEKKATTVVQPFNLTTIHKKVNEPIDQPIVPKFHAQPVPRSLRSPHKVTKVDQPTTRAQSPKFSKRFAKVTDKALNHVEPIQKCPGKPAKPIKNTEIKPFSFEQRDQELKEKKKKFINEVIENEKKAREFHANPLPKSILRSRNGSKDDMTDHNSTTSSKNRSFDEPPVFKARPATVLTAKPFQPKKEEHYIEFAEFNFKTERRAEDWKDIIKKIKDREMAIEENKKRTAEEQLRKEEQEKVLLRKQTEYKAQPIKKYKPVEIKLDHKATDPVGFNFETDRIRNKENFNSTND